MLTYLKIENLALIECSEVEFAPGFNVITGETGAGKSILLGAISLLLGERADRSVIRAGAERCEICGSFLLPETTALDVAPLLAAAEIPFDLAQPELQLRRIITENGGRCHINNVPVTVRMLHDLGELLIDVHGANEHQSLISRTRQLELLDRYAGSEAERKACAELCAELTALEEERAAFERDMPSGTEAAHLELLIGEIEKVAPVSGEDAELAARHALASNSRQIMEDTARLAALLGDGESSVSEQLSQAYRVLQELARLDEARGSEFLDRCAVLSESVRDLADDLADFGGNVELNEQEFQELEERLSQLHTLKRHYGPTLERVLETLEEAKVRLDDYRRGSEKRSEFDRREKELRRMLKEAAAALTRLRQTKAKEFTAQVRAKLGAIGFAAGALEPAFSAIEPGANGQDQLELLFSANPGEPPQPLRKIASSGELSRLMLALKTVLSDADRVPVAIFDEIDVNIGGETACRVAAELQSLGQRRQLLAISHLPQVAARGDAHFAVSKGAEEARTVSHIVRLRGDDRLNEIARMLGGSKAALKHARDILKDGSR